MDFIDSGAGRPALVLHGGGGPMTVAPLVSHLSSSMRVIAPTLPGWNGAPRPASLASVRDYAVAIDELLESLGLDDVLVVGSSLGGWIGAELACVSARVGSLVLVDAVGISVPGEPLPDFFALSPREVAEHAYADPDRFFVDPSSLPPAVAETMASNMATMKAIAGDMQDPTLPGRLSSVSVDVLAIWGAADRICTPAYGRAFASLFPSGRFSVIEGAGHLPQIEQPEALFSLIDGFV